VTGTAVTLAASPSPGYVFTGWSSPCSGTGSCSLTLSAAATVNANFSPILTVKTSGSGAVTSTPAGISCGQTCSATVTLGGTVTLTASPAAGQTFLGWLGDGCSGTALTCTLTASAPATVTASFSAPFNTGDIPLPPWALAALGGLLLWFATRADRWRRGQG
jgi:hypothetical protein